MLGIPEEPLGLPEEPGCNVQALNGGVEVTHVRYITTCTGRSTEVNGLNCSFCLEALEYNGFLFDPDFAGVFNGRVYTQGY